MKFDVTQFHSGPSSVDQAFHRFAGRVVPGVLLVIGFGLLGASSASATDIPIGTTTGWNAWNSGLTGNYLTDPGADQQTGQGTDDYIGNATTPAMMQQAGTIGGVQSILFRARMGKYSATGFGAGNGANLSLGIDVNGNGQLDLIMDMHAKGSKETIEFAAPGAGLNNGPSTTSWGNFFGTITLTDGTDYDYRQVTDGVTLNSNGTSTPGTENGSTGSSYAANAWVTFAISYANLQAAVRSYAAETVGGIATDFSNYTLDYTSWLSFIGFTSTQGNAINQDLLGTEGNTNSTMTFSQLGTSTTYIRPNGGPVPEPASVYQLGGLLGAGLIVWAWRKRRSASGMNPIPR